MRKCSISVWVLLLALVCISLSACSSNEGKSALVTDVSSVSQTVATEAATTSFGTDTRQITEADSTEVPTTAAVEIKQTSTVQSSLPSESIKNEKVTGELKVTYLDVGQADCILIQNGSSSMLIDAGNNGDADAVIGYIKEQGIDKLDYVIGTHPHEDHIGGLDAVIKTFDIDVIYMPKVTTTTKTFEDVILAIRSKGMSIKTPIPGSTFSLGDAKCIILAPNSDTYDELNNYSIVIRLDFGKTSFLFTGDAQSESEEEILTKGFDLHADVLKVGHHGSNTSTSLEFLKAVSPKYAVIQVGKGNDYGHPAEDTIDKLSDAGVKIYRTDESGTIIATSNGETINFDIKASAIKPQAPPETKPSAATETTENITQSTTKDDTNNIIVYITKTGEKYHKDGCRYLSKSKIPIELSEIKGSKYTPCSVCNPPK